ncbi:MAG: helix-turn-helix domain-containing protein [Chloroherpetonaceae bacterium]|nr:helix-turn-helix domain-containing protein [Chthonomonadaceae bacterium]MDW8208253.1 helix-turn-helix domain-containing protein [Chloroherpetonaceae bacterium]
MVTENTTPTEAESLTVTEAARRLNVSERTVYRMLQSGKIQRASMSDNRRTYVILNNDLSLKGSRDQPTKTDTLSDMTSLQTMKAELEEKSRIIGQLIENQRDMLQTIQQLQLQLSELARWILTQQKDNQEKQGNASATPQNSSSQTRELLRRWFRL